MVVAIIRLGLQYIVATPLILTKALVLRPLFLNKATPKQRMCQFIAIILLTYNIFNQRSVASVCLHVY